MTVFEVIKTRGIFQVTLKLQGACEDEIISHIKHQIRQLYRTTNTDDSLDLFDPPSDKVRYSYEGQWQTLLVKLSTIKHIPTLRWVIRTGGTA